MSVQYNLRHTVKQGEGKRIEFTLRDANGIYDLTGKTITMTCKKGSTTTVDAVSVTLGNQITAPGTCFYDWVAADTAALSTGDHHGNLKVSDGAGGVWYWPTDANDSRSYFVVEVQKPIG